MSLEHQAAPELGAAWGLHIGCGPCRIDEFINIDCRKTAATDLVSPAWDLSAFKDASVEYIYARHMLEHLTFADAARTLEEWRRVLCDGGIVHIVVPDLLFHARQILGLSQCPGRNQQEHALAGFYGWQNPANGGAQEDLHRWGYTPASLERLLLSKDFKITHDGIQRLTERDCEPWHINMRGIK